MCNRYLLDRLSHRSDRLLEVESSEVHFKEDAYPNPEPRSVCLNSTMVSLRHLLAAYSVSPN